MNTSVAGAPADPIDPNAGTDADVDESDDGFDSGFTDEPRPTDAPRPPAEGGEGEDATPPPPAAPPVYVTQAKLDEARAELAAELRQAQDRGFGTIGNTIRELKASLGERGESIQLDQGKIDRIRSLEKDFPEFGVIGDALEKINRMQVIAPKMDEAAIDTRVQAQLVPLEERVSRKIHTELVDDAHPDWRDVTKTPAWIAWEAKQDAATRTQLASSWKSGFIIKQLTKFKSESAAAAPRTPAPPPSDPGDARRSRLRTGTTPRGSGSPPAAPDPEESFDDGFKTGTG